MSSTKYDLKIFKLSQVEDCSLKRKGSLDFEFEAGACNTFDRNGTEQVYLCFSSTDAQTCKMLVL